MRTEQKVLSMFRDVSLTRPDRARLRRVMDNWLSIHAHVVETEKRVHTMGVEYVHAEMMRMLLLEITDTAMRPKPRWIVIHRLHTRAAKWRKRIERYEVSKWLDARAKARLSRI